MNIYLDGLYRSIEQERSAIMPLIRERNILIEKNLPIDSLLNKIFTIKERQRQVRDLITKTKKVISAVELKPCIIDYVVNFGLKEVNIIWRSALHKDDDLFSSISFPNQTSKN
jgi:hypothetical protein